MPKEIYFGLDKQKRLAWARMKAQAKFRKEEWDLSWEDFIILWTDDLWEKRSKKSNGLVMMRTDIDKPWQFDNVVIIARHLQLSVTKQKNYK
jgi:hypothetical protein